jgi:hypothetical protein
MNKVLAICAGGLSVACFYTEERAPAPPPMAPASGAVVDTIAASGVIGEARCDHEARCNGFGPSPRYSNFDHCMSVTREESMRRFGGCRYGVKDRELGQCVYEIRTQACGGVVAPLDWFERSFVCRVDRLCLN